MAVEQLLSDNPQTIASGILTAITQDQNSELKRAAEKGVAYYNGKHDILDNRIFFINDDGELTEDKYASNVRIPHGFLTELIDQKVQYLLSNKLEYDVEDEAFLEYLTEYYDEDFQVFLQEMLEGASKKGVEYAFARTTSDDKLAFQVADSLKVAPIFDSGNVLQRLLRYYDKEITRDGKKVTLTYAEVWDSQQVYFFIAEKGKAFELDTTQPLNPRPHIIAIAENGEDQQLLQRDLGQIPFYRLQNNTDERTDLAPVKELIDDYDLMNAYLSNNLQDFADAIYVVSGFQGDDLSKLRQNVKAKKVVGVGDSGGIDIKTVNIPVEGRKAKMDIDKENIYKFGMGFDSTAIGDGNITNIVIKSRYTLLNMKANKAEARLQALLKWINELVTEDINRRFSKAYSPKDVTFTLTREVLANDTDLVANAKTEADTKQVLINAIMTAAPKLDNDSVLKLICEQFELDWEEVRDKLEEADYSDVAAGTEPQLDSNGDVVSEKVPAPTQGEEDSEALANSEVTE